ncbi:hypothetical protein CAPTEDRAFT_211818 [Capitella teleta]|uniref:EF-hand domain-containing protein n=1 Tax=Capitella teleta TaxID=283909 RepID=R7UC85_CAPTE|nr:hypothetical protein CAPTEDRAFT_211818 [Capitella teleta]|eukprot:ELU03965.1 hypothetical protein CAPTEDRAFT_211818 [Capitella teleta]
MKHPVHIDTGADIDTTETNEKKLLQLYCRDKYNENKTAEAKPLHFLRRQSTLYQRMNPTTDVEMNLQEVEEALQQINGHLISEKEMQFIFQVLDLPGRRRINVKLFSAVAALSEKVVQERPKREVSQTQIESPPVMTEPPKQRRPPPSFKPKRKPRERKPAPILRARPSLSAKKEIKEFANPLDYLAKYCIIQKKSPKRKTDSSKDAKKDDKFVTHLARGDEDRGLETSRTIGLPTDLDVVNRMDKKMMQKITVFNCWVTFEPQGERANQAREANGKFCHQIQLAQLASQFRSKPAYGVYGREFWGMSYEKKLLQLYCRDKYNENKTAEAKPLHFLRRQSTLYQRMNPTTDVEMNLQEVEEALQQINGHLISEKEMQFIFQVLDLPGRRRINVKLFSAVAALSEKVVQVEYANLPHCLFLTLNKIFFSPFIKKLLNKLDFEALSVKMDRVKELFYLLDEQDDNVPTGKISAETLGVELAAGGVVGKFNREKKGIVDFLDFLIYVPLFIEIHSRIIDNPLDGDRSM